LPDAATSLPIQAVEARHHLALQRQTHARPSRQFALLPALFWLPLCVLSLHRRQRPVPQPQ